ncbi:hypothetical protein HWV62_2711 [Athelia sp. TMB]|nr:hypothetical protein HWV62_2711 [Athelia sp. TMB]
MGQDTPPMYGDYEAQRHWMELTINLPLRQWYTYDLQYWGLDYPPLTAGSRINPTWFALDASRGIETPESKIYMRATVLVLDALIYIPALVMFVSAWQGSRSLRTQNFALLVLLLQPALLLVDFGHFQYNSVMLGFTLLAMNFFATGHDVLGALCFVLSLGFKQMALYYAPAIGSYLLGKCVYLGTLEGIFPFNRGLFEDKVANFWCSSNVVFKWKNWIERDVLVKLSTGLTALGFFPSVVGLIRGAIISAKPVPDDKDTAPITVPTLPLLPYALLTSSMSFYLFSFQVHEKTILVPLLPMTLLLSGASPDSSVFAWGVLANNVGVFRRVSWS